VECDVVADGLSLLMSCTLHFYVGSASLKFCACFMKTHALDGVIVYPKRFCGHVRCRGVVFACVVSLFVMASDMHRVCRWLSPDERLRFIRRHCCKGRMRLVGHTCSASMQAKPLLPCTVGMVYIVVFICEINPTEHTLCERLINPAAVMEPVLTSPPVWL